MVIVVENDDSMRRALLRLLAAEGITANGYVSAESFLCGEVLNRVTCLVLDMHLDGMDGIELSAHLRQLGLAIPTIFLSASEEGKLDELVAKAGGVALFRKPFEGKELIAATLRIMDARDETSLSDNHTEE